MYNFVLHLSYRNYYNEVRVTVSQAGVLTTLTVREQKG